MALGHLHQPHAAHRPQTALAAYVPWSCLLPTRVACCGSALAHANALYPRTDSGLAPLLGRAPLLTANVIELADSNSHAYALCARLRGSLLREEQRASTFLQGIPDLEVALACRQATINAAVRAPAATADSVVDALISESHAIVSATVGMSSGTASSGAAETHPMASAKTMQDALQHANFRELATTLEGLSTDTSAERCRVLLAVAAGKCAIALRVLVCGTVSIARMHPALGKILESRQDAAAYFGMVLTVDPVTLKVPARLEEWTWAGRQGTDVTMMRSFMNLKLQPLEWYNGENGINSINALKLGPHMKPAFTHPLDVYSTTQGIKQLSDFIHRITCAIGAPDTVSASVGFTMLTWGAFYSDHLERAFSLATREEQVAWLDDAAQQFHLALGVVEIQLTQFILSTQPDIARLVCLLPIDCAPAEHLRRKEANLVLIERQADARSWFSAPKLPGHDPETVALPLLSDYASLIHFFVPLTASATKKSPRDKKGTKRPIGEDGPPSVLEPGSLAHTWMWLSPNKTLLLSNCVWDVAKIAADLKIANPGALAWPMLLSQRRAEDLPALLKADDSKAAAFKLIDGISPQLPDFRAKYRRTATDEEKAKLPPVPAGAPASRGRAGGKGGQGGRGSKGRGGRGGRGAGRSNFRRPA